MFLFIVDLYSIIKIPDIVHLHTTRKVPTYHLHNFSIYRGLAHFHRGFF